MSEKYFIHVQKQQFGHTKWLPEEVLLNYVDS